MSGVAASVIENRAVGSTLGWGKTLSYSAPTAAMSAAFFLNQFYLLNFATDILLLAPGLVGVLLAISRIWDAISDPLVGRMSDRTRTRFGRRKPWIVGGGISFGLSVVLLWAPPASMGSAALAGWLGVLLIAFMTTGTAWSIPHQAWGAELAGTPHRRTGLFGFRLVFSMVGVAAAFGAMQAIANADSPREMASQLALYGGGSIACVLIVPALFLDERSRREPEAPSGHLAVLGRMLARPAARRLLGARLASNIGTGAQGTIAPYTAIYLLERPDLIGVLPATYIVPLIVSIPLWVVAARRYGRTVVWVGSMLVGAVAHIGLFWISSDTLVIAILLTGLVGFTAGSAGSVGPSLLADLIDLEENETRERSDGVYFAVWEFVEKTAGAIIVIFVAMALQVAGFEANARQGAAADFAIRFCLAIFPALMLVMASACLWQRRRSIRSS